MAMLTLLGGCVAPPSVTPSKCGDGVVDSITDEECDDGGQSASCDVDCTLAMCGDGHVNAAAGGECNHGDTVSGEGCSAACQIERCDVGESCLASYCGDGVVDEAASEECDAGDVETADCDLDCTVVTCGDGYVNITAGEECEGGASIFCDSDCTGAWCGDGMPNAAAGEACDDGNTGDSDWCLTSCESASCEDGIRNGDEQDVDCGGQCDACWATQAMIVTGDNHTCALLETGAVRCWGGGGNGQLGYGHLETIGDDETAATSGDVNVGGRVVQLAAGGVHTCAMLETGAVRCWGEGYQLGYGNTNHIGDDEAPAMAGDVNVGGRVVQLAAGSYHACALLEVGAVRCWGAGPFGQLGHGNTDSIGNDEAPAMAGDVNVGGRVVQLAAARSHTCALLETGAVRCWGRGGHGQLGYGNQDSIGDDEAPATAGDVNVGGRAVQLAAGGEHTCALLEMGVVRCWGEGDHGQLGYGNSDEIGDDEAPATSGDVNVGGRVVQLAAGHITRAR